MADNISNTHALAFTGGTFTMGYVTGAFLKRVSSKEYASLKDKEYYLYPLYDIRHVAVAACIDASKTLSPERKNQLQAELVETAPLIEERILAAKAKLARASELDAQLSRRLNDIAAQSESGLTSEKALARYGLAADRVVTPYFIDSIEYNERAHDEPLYAAARSALLGKKHQTFFVVGGTDTLVQYSGKLTRRLVDEGLIGKSNGNKVLFISAMKSFGYGPEGIRETPEGEVEKWRDSQRVPRAFQISVVPPVDPHITHHPQHIARIFRMTMQLANPSTDPKKSLPPGGYIVSALDEECHALTVHDARESMKVYSNFIDAFRSKTPAGVIYDDKQRGFELNPRYHSKLKATSSPDKKVPHVTVAPPLISGNSTGAILNYLQEMRDTPVIVMGMMPTLGTPLNLMDAALDYQAIETVKYSTPVIPWQRRQEVMQATLDVIRERAERGVPTYFVNPDIYNINRTKVEPMISPRIWAHGRFFDEIQKAGGILVSGVTVPGAYQDIQRQLGKTVSVHGVDKIRKLGGVPERPVNKAVVRIPMEKGDPVGIEYIPDPEAFAKGASAAARLSKDVVLSVLPGGVVPGHVATFVGSQPKDQSFTAAFQYGHEHRRWLQHIQKPERVQPPSWYNTTHAKPISSYAPAQAFLAAGGHTSGDYSPQEIMAGLQKSAGLDGVSQLMAEALPFPRNWTRPSTSPRTP